ncbi:MAG: GAF domain-containing protein, partial [Cyclobacteriaceae bacterium]|nr:GAF domain-containing protein [Cyclobacteriaceae bacterium]
MIKAPVPVNEEARLLALNELSILNTAPEQEYDELVQLAAYICEMEAAQISLIDKDRQWIKSSVGNLSKTVDRDIAFCSHTILQTDALVIEDASLDNRFFDNPFVTEHPGLRFYAGIPLITSDGHGIGSLCVLDIKPRKLRPAQLKALHVLGKQVIKQMELRKALSIIQKQNEKLDDLNKMNLRLISIIGHDVRSPLSSLASLLDLADRGLLSKTEE